MCGCDLSDGPQRSCCEDYVLTNNIVQQQPELTIEDYCHPHPYYGDDGEMGRCYCGVREYPKGGST